MSKTVAMGAPKIPWIPFRSLRGLKCGSQVRSMQLIQRRPSAHYNSPLIVAAPPQCTALVSASTSFRAT